MISLIFCLCTTSCSQENVAAGLRKGRRAATFDRLLPSRLALVGDLQKASHQMTTGAGQPPLDGLPVRRMHLVAALGRRPVVRMAINL